MTGNDEPWKEQFLFNEIHNLGVSRVTDSVILFRHGLMEMIGYGLD